MAAQLKRRLGNLFEAMPRDLQQTMLSAPRRASMLQSLRVQSKVAVPGMPVPVRDTSVTVCCLRCGLQGDALRRVHYAGS